MSDHAPPTRLVLRAAQPVRFKAAFKPRPISFDAFNVIIGRNGSGKSTLLEGIQWLDSAIRRDAREATERYHSINDLINFRSKTQVPYFELDLTWDAPDDDTIEYVRYIIRVSQRADLPVIDWERLTYKRPGETVSWIIETPDDSPRHINPYRGNAEPIKILDPDRLAIARLGDTRLGDPVSDAVTAFWANAVFLRLSPHRLTETSPSSRRSFEPILDEEGSNLATLLYEFSEDELEDLADDIQGLLPGIKGVERRALGRGREARVAYSLLERMPYVGRTGRRYFEIPAWMLSEGTRRITAILALLKRSDAPSILCIEEIENGLDPWSVRSVLHLLEDATNRTQVVLTTHSPWLLDDVPLDSILLARRREGETEYTQFSQDATVRRFDPSLPAGVRYLNLEDYGEGREP